MPDKRTPDTPRGRRKRGRTEPRRYRGRTKPQLRAERRERLLRAAVELLATRGYQAVSIERICRRARVANRHFYEHFESSEELLATLFDAFVEDVLAAILDKLGEPGHENPLERAIEAVRAAIRPCLEQPQRARVALIETVGVSRAMESKRREAIHRLARVVADAADRLAEDGVIPDADYQLPAIALVGATMELLVEFLSGESGRSAEQMERQIAAIFEAIIRGAWLQAEAGHTLGTSDETGSGDR